MSVGLSGDGDEIAAIDDVERAFGVKLDYSDASRWVTAGDVFDALQNALPREERDRAGLWDRFALSLAAETGVDPKKVERGSPLMSEWRFWGRAANASAVVWIIIVLGFVIAIGLAVLAGR